MDSKTRSLNGDLPHGWSTPQLDELAEVTAGGSAPQESRFFGGEFPFVRVSHLDVETDSVTGCDRITSEAATAHGLRLFPAGTILLPKSGASVRLEKRAMLPFDSYVVSHLAAVLPDPTRVDPDFLFFALRCVRFAARKSGGYPTLKLSDIRQTTVPLPPLAEQRAIAQALMTIRRAREQTEQVIWAAQELRRSLAQHLFAYGPVRVDEAERVVVAETSAGTVPAHWEVRPLGDVAQIRTSTTSQLGIEETADASAERLLFLKVSDLADPRNRRGIVTAASEFRVSSPIPTEIKYVPSGSVVLPKRGAAIATNRKRQLAQPSLLDPNLAAITAGPRLQPDFLFRWAERLDLRAITDAATLPQLNKKDLAPLAMPVPPLEEQARIAEALEAVEAKISGEDQRRASLNALFASLLNGLMTARIRVDLATGKFAG